MYSVRETATDSSHILDLREYHMGSRSAGRTSTLTIEIKRPNLTVYKHDADTGEPIADTVFESVPQTVTASIRSRQTARARRS